MKLYLKEDVMKLPKSMKKQIKEEQRKCFEIMSKENIDQAKWDDAKKKYEVYSAMLKPSWRITPDTLLVCLTNIGGIFLVLNFEKLDIVRSKAMGFVLKGKL